MSNVVELPVAGPDAPVLTYRSLRPLSSVLSLLFAALAGLSVLSVVAACVVTLFYADHLLVGASGADLVFGHPPLPRPGWVVLASQPPLTRLAGVVDVAVASVPLILIFWNLRGLFRLYRQGIVFARANAGHLRRVGIWLVAYPFAKFAANLLFRAAGGTDKAWFSMPLVDSLVLGLTVFVIAQVMAYGREIEEEKDSFV